MNQNTYRIQARSLETAMQEVKDRFGPDALVLDVKETRKKEAGSLGVGTVFEVSVMPEGTRFEGARAAPSSSIPYSNNDLLTLQREIERVEKLAASVNELGNKLTGISRSNDNYPLYDMLMKRGASSKTVRMLASSYEDQIPIRDGASLKAAAGHLGGYLKTVNPCRWDEISGIHMFFGPGGSGKTSLIVKLAGRIADSGGSVAILTLFPRHSGEIKRLEVVGEALNIETAVAFSLDEFRRSVDYLSRNRTILIDTPCVLTVKELITEEFGKVIAGLDLKHLHYVFDLNSVPQRLEKEIEVFGQLGCDYAVISKLDIANGGAGILELVVRQSIIFSLINDSPDFDRGLEIAAVSKLMSVIDPSLVQATDGSARISLNYESVTPDNNTKAPVPDVEGVTVGVGANE